MWSSIPENLKKINRALSWTDCLSIAFTALILSGFSAYIHAEKKDSIIPVEYIEVKNEGGFEAVDVRPFASKNGTTYTFSWCQGAGVISKKNKIYFGSEADAIASGRIVSKLCTR